jgi:hypothetical protein
VNDADDLGRLLERALAPAEPDVLGAIERGPIDPADALPPDELDPLVEAAHLPCETGWCRLPDGSAYTAVRTPMREVSGEMLDWWFGWHPHDPLRYRIWFPGAHADISFEPARARRRKEYWDTVHHPVEDIGLGMQRLRIRFLDPAAFGFSARAIEHPAAATIVCGIVGDDRRRAWHTRICHVARHADDGVELRSRFWIGSELRLFARGAPARAINRVLSRPAVRRRLIPARAPVQMARHCAAEYANLASLLPELFARYGDQRR